MFVSALLLSLVPVAHAAPGTTFTVGADDITSMTVGDVPFGVSL